jgi:excisionase family DNA binding protein
MGGLDNEGAKMSKEIEQMIEGWIDTREAAELVDYTQEYIRRLARQERIKAAKIAGRDWLINKESLLEHQRTVKPGRPKEKD